MSCEQKQYIAGIDWASEDHHIRVIDDKGNDLGERVFKHSGDGFHDVMAWLLDVTGALPSDIAIAIEVPHGPLVEFFLEHGFEVNAINPKQLDRFRDRFSLAGSKDDSLDCLVLASSLRTDRHCFRKIEVGSGEMIQLREWSRMHDELTHDRTRLTNRLRQQLWRYFPAFLELDDDLSTEWLLDLWLTIPTPAKAAGVRSTTVTAILRKHRIRRLDADKVLEILRQTSITVMAGSIVAACDHISTLIPQIRLFNRQIKQVHKNLDTLIAHLSQPRQDVPQQQQPKHRDAAILASAPGIGRVVISTMFAEAWQALERRDYRALRAMGGSAPVTKSSGKQKFVVRRLAFNPRLSTAFYHWARTAIQHDPKSRIKYNALRARGKNHARALRSVVDRLLFVVCAMLRSGELYNKPQVA